MKPLTKMNATGPALRRLAERMGLAGDECILLQDDIDLPLGAVRVRMAGGDGGHRGVRSVLETFETFAVRRVKLGVGRPQQHGLAARHVVSAFGPAEAAVIDKACLEAVARVGELAGLPRRRRAEPDRSFKMPRTGTAPSGPS